MISLVYGIRGEERTVITAAVAEWWHHPQTYYGASVISCPSYSLKPVQGSDHMTWLEHPYIRYVYTSFLNRIGLRMCVGAGLRLDSTSLELYFRLQKYLWLQKKENKNMAHLVLLVNVSGLIPLPVVHLGKEYTVYLTY